MTLILNTKRHKTLSLLSHSFIKFNSGQIDSDFKFGVSFKDLQSELKCDRNKLETIIGTLYLNKEVEYTDTAVIGLASTLNGFNSFTNEKYLKENRKIIINLLKDFVQIVIPVLALLIAYTSLTTKMDSLKTLSDKELQEVKKSIQKQKEHTESLEYKIQILTNHKKDSL
jgi:hypothetical protein